MGFCRTIVASTELAETCGNHRRGLPWASKLGNDLLDYLNQYISDNMVMLIVYVEDPGSSLTTLKRDIDETQSEFVGNIGGLMSLAMGASFITIFDVTYMAMRVLQENMKRFCKYRFIFQNHERIRNYTSG